MKTKFLKTISLIAFSVLFVVNSQAQCKRYTKKYCLPALTPYVNNGQLTSAIMAPGEAAEIMLTFVPGHDYRLLLCSQELIGEALFKIKDKTGKIIYERRKPEQKPYFDFNVTSTQQLTIEVYIPNKENPNELIPTGCVTLMVGFKD